MGQAKIVDDSGHTLQNQWDTTRRHPSSNFGSKTGEESIEIYGPYCTFGLQEPDSIQDPNAKTLCGTSYASPFVAGVAALVKSADPNLSNDEVWQILKETAHIGGIGLFNGTQRRINAFGAVNRALGEPYTAPTITINEPDEGDTFGLQDTIEFTGHAIDFKGDRLPISWRSSIDGAINSQPEISTVFDFDGLASGTHSITASATDITGITSSARVTIEVAKRSPKLFIQAPTASSVLFEGVEFKLIGRSEDPDNEQLPLPDSQVRWHVRRLTTNNTVLEKTGHRAKASLDAGLYQARFSAGGGDSETQTSVNFTVEDRPPGKEPNAIIIEPNNGDTFFVEAGIDVTVTLSGKGVDPEDGNLPATRYRWTVIDEEKETVVCTGSNFGNEEGAGNVGGLFGTLMNCSQVEVKLKISGNDPTAHNIIRFEVKDFSGWRNASEIEVLVRSQPL
jgi:hypothetical protein